MANQPKRKPEDANRYIRPDTRTHIDHDKEALQRKIAEKVPELIRGGDLNGLFKLMKEARLTDEQRERVISLYREFHGISTKNV